MRELDEGKPSAIPSELIEDLQSAAVLLVQEQCLEAVGMFDEHDHELCVHLRPIVEGLEYKEVLETLDRVPGTGGAK